MTAPNRIRDFDREKFSIIAYCQECRHSATLDMEQLQPELAIPELRRRLRCTECGARGAEIRIVYVAAGGYKHL